MLRVDQIYNEFFSCCETFAVVSLALQFGCATKFAATAPLLYCCCYSAYICQFVILWHLSFAYETEAHANEMQWMRNQMTVAVRECV